MKRTDQACALAAQIRDLNDAFRTSLVGGRILLTPGVSERGGEFQLAALAAIRAFTAFDAANDPYAEHDFGCVEFEGSRMFFKIDYYDVDLQGHSPDPSDTSITCRVLTVMLAEEY